MVLSRLPDSAMLPSGDMAMAFTPALCPCSVRRFCHAAAFCVALRVGLAVPVLLVLVGTSGDCFWVQALLAASNSTVQQRSTCASQGQWLVDVLVGIAFISSCTGLRAGVWARRLFRPQRPQVQRLLEAVRELRGFGRPACKVVGTHRAQDGAACVLGNDQAVKRGGRPRA